jgi:F-type H+-transporting ATPase subunit b
MGAILDTLGLNLPAFLWHSANFLVLLFLLWRVLFKPVTRMLDERARRVRDSLDAADEARRRLEQTQADREALLAETRREAELIRSRADESAKRMIADAEASAQEKANQILARAQADIEASRLQMLAEVRGSVADLVVTAVERVTRGAVDASSQRRLVEQFLSDGRGGASPSLRV